MTVSLSTTRVADAQGLWTHQLRGKTNIDAVTSLFATESQSYDTIIQDILTARTIEGAIGKQLDDLGNLVGQPREGRTDERYRVWIRARIIANRSSGNPPDMYAIAAAILGTAMPLTLHQIPTGHAMEAGASSPVPIDDFWQIMQGASSAGVPFWYHYLLHSTDTFTLGSTTGWTPTPAQGLGSGRLRGAWGATTRAADPAGLTVLKSSMERWRLDKFITDGADVTSISGEYYAETLAQTGSDTPPTGHLNTLKDSHTELRFPTSTVDPLVSTSTRLMGALQGSWAVAWVGKPPVVATPPAYVLRAFEVTLAGDYRLAYNNSGGIEYHIETLSTIQNGNVNNIPNVEGRAGVYVVSYNGAGTLSVVVNGHRTDTSITHYAEMDTVPFDEFRIGTFEENYSTSCGSLYDLAFWDRGLTSTEMEDLSTYLMREYLDWYSSFDVNTLMLWSSERDFTSGASPNATWDDRFGLSCTGGANLAADEYGKIDAAEFSATTHGVSAALPADVAAVFSGTREFTIAWYGSSNAAGTETVIEFHDNGVGDDWLYAGLSGGTPRLSFRQGGGAAKNMGSPTAVTTAPTSYILVYEGGGTGTIYLDGVANPLGSVATPTMTNLTHVTVGNSDNTNTRYWGKLGMLQVLPYALTRDEATALHRDMQRRFERD